MLLDDKVVFLTGAASGIGRECALACAREGASVVIADIDPGQARQTAADIGPAASGCGVRRVRWPIGRASGSGGARALRPHRRGSQQRRHLGAIQAAGRDHGNRVGPPDRRQSEKRLLDHARRVSRSEAEPGRDSEYRQHGRTDGAGESRRLRRHQRRDDLAHQVHGTGLRAVRCSGECRVPGGSVDTHAGAVGRGTARSRRHHQVPRRDSRPRRPSARRRHRGCRGVSAVRTGRALSRGASCRSAAGRNWGIDDEIRDHYTSGGAQIGASPCTAAPGRTPSIPEPRYAFAVRYCTPMAA